MNKKIKVPKRFKWTVEFEVDALWVADGFDLDDERALEILGSELGYACMSTELAAKVIAAPPRSQVLQVQGYYREAQAAKQSEQPHDQHG